MANVKLLFFGAENSNTENTSLEVSAGDLGLLIEVRDLDSEWPEQWIVIDKDTAIRLSKTIKTEISKL